MHATSKSCVLLYWQRYSMALQQRGQPNFAALSRGHHLYSTGQPSGWASARILVSSFSLLSQPSQIGCLPYFHTWFGLSANLGCRSETCTRLAENNRHLGTIAQLCQARIDNRKKIVKQQYLPHMSSQYGELRPTSGWDQFVSFGAPQLISTGFASWQRYCTAL